MFGRNHKPSLLKPSSRKDTSSTRLQPDLLQSTDNQSPQHTTENPDAESSMNLNETLSITQDIIAQEQPGLISQLISASAKENNESAVERRTNKSFSDDNHCEEFDTTKWGIKVIRKQPPENIDAIDIIAIHGLDGHWEAAWTDPKTHVNWLKSLLAEDIPHARIMAYSYNSKEYFSKSNADIKDFASDLLADYRSYRTSVAEKSRPTIFLCHSLGGIVFKQALVRANEEPEYSNILGHVHGVIFFGTPHRGASSAKWGSIVANVVRAASLNTSTNVISSDLKLRSDLLTNIAESWTQQGGNLEIISCYETMSMNGMIVVDQDSALLQWPKETKLLMNANHSTICKFSNRSEPDYRKVISRLKEMSERAIRKFKKTEQPLSESQRQFLVCLETTDYESHLIEIEQFVKGTCKWILKTERYREWEISTTGKLLWISADAGCGKSVLAKYLIQHHKELKPEANICFFIFKNGNSEQEDCVHGLSAILHQIYSSQPELMEHAIRKQKYFARGNNLKKPFEALWEVFEETIHDKRLQNTLCIIDALDECEELTRLLLVEKLALLFTKERKVPFPLKVIVTSRPENTIKSAFMTIPNIRLRGEDELAALNHDIRVFVQTNVNRIAARSDLPADLLTDLQHALIDGADFTFLWTSLVIQLLKERSLGGMSRADLESILRTRNLDDLYENLLSSRPSPLKAKKMLYIVIAAARPLSLEELSIAVEVHQDYKQSRRKSLPPGKKLEIRKTADIRWMESADPSQSHGKLENLDALRQHVKQPFSNHIRQICGNFLRIRGHRVYLVHQTARQFLLRKTAKSDFSTGYCLRDFRWNISCPTAREMRHIEQHGMPGIFEGTKEDAYLQPSQVWRHSVRHDVANRYLFQVCVDYLKILEEELTVRERVLQKEIQFWTDGQGIGFTPQRRELVSNWELDIKAHPCGVFLDYVARYWVTHYQSVRTDVNNRFDYLCIPSNSLFILWIKQHPSFIIANQKQWAGQPKSLSGSEDDIVTKIYAKEISPHYNLEEYLITAINAEKISLQDVFEYFDLDAEMSELWDQENIEGPQYWKHSDDSSTDDDEICDDEEQDDEFTVPPENDHKSKLSKVPDRVLSFRRQHRENFPGTMQLSSNPGTAGSSYLSVGNSLRFSSTKGLSPTRMEEASAADVVQVGFSQGKNIPMPRVETEKLVDRPYSK